MKKTTLALALFVTPYAFGASISGTIVDAQQQPIANAVITVSGESSKTLSDENGRFTIQAEPGKHELHVVKAQFAHLDVHVDIPAQGLQALTYQLEPTSIEVIDVTASPFHASMLESAMPATVLGGDQLRLEQVSTLGDTLDNQVGVHSNFYGGVSSSPIIRGLDGPRVMITQNGLDTSDVSRVGPDHLAAAEAMTAQQIEVLRGPATLFYGSGAIGGVVNVVDGRIPQTANDQAEVMLSHSSVDDGHVLAAMVETGSDDTRLYLDALDRQANAYAIPGYAELVPDEDEEAGQVANTQSETQAFTLGLSRLFAKGFIGLAVEKQDRLNGIPGHAHAHADETVEDEAMTEDAHGVTSDMSMTRYQLQAGYQLSGLFNQVNVNAAYTDYQHAEIEDEAIGTVFTGETTEVRIELLQPKHLGWRGGLNLHYKSSDFAAQGDEAFTPASNTEMVALALMEEKHLGDVLLQLGGRIEQVTITAPTVAYNPHLLEDHEAEAAAEEHSEEELVALAFDKSYRPVSLSAGLVWDYAPGYNFGVSLARAQRAPSAAELLSFGPHIATASYEMGALFTLHDEAGEQHVEIREGELPMETSHNIDLVWRKYTGDLGVVLNLFYNEVDNYYYADNSGLEYFAEEHDHALAETEAEHAEHADEGMPVYVFAPHDVKLYGLEAQVNYRLNDHLVWQNQFDYLQGKIKGQDNLPRVSPKRLISTLQYTGQQFDGQVQVKHLFTQDDVANNETATDGYTLLNANINYNLNIQNADVVLYLQAKNLLDEEARVHTSLLKDVAPLPGRNVIVGIRSYF